MATLKIGLVGCGGRGRGAVVNALRNTATKDVKVTALADAFPDSIDGTVNLLASQFPNQTAIPREQMFSGLDCCEKLLKTDVDVVLLCEPPGFRPRHFVAAVESGKHIFSEKPVAVDAPGVRMFLEANQKAKKNKQIVLVGHHLRYEPKHYESIKMVHDGAIGDIIYAKIFFDTNDIWTRARRPEQTEMEYQVKNWYHFTWLSGDHIVEQHVHDIDVMNWFMKDQHPVEANGMGGRTHHGNQYGEINDYNAVEFVYGEREIRGFSDCRQINGCWNSFSEHVYGTKGCLNMDGHGDVVLRVNGKEPKVWKRTYDGHQYEMDALFDAVVNGKELNFGDIAANSTMTAILGRMAAYSGKVVKWEQAFRSDLDTFPKVLAWDAEPGPKADADGIYPCAKQGVTKAF
ncbi:MAG: Gfo/Idh/MocA family oxidoreductase [Planctomycetaceae bacterium]|jgi:predicted dehydrogenase|nr:Gfo/Idh/MocA family oxidoreductase [Planctomycetaceae bacterium]